MKLLWLCNIAPGKVKEKLSGKAVSGGLWVDHVLSGLRQKGLRIHILCPGTGAAGELDENCSFATFVSGRPEEYRPDVEANFQQVLREFVPDVIHIWGVEYAHTLAMVNAAQKENLLDRCAVSIQGLTSLCVRHYTEGIPHRVQRAFTFRDAVRRDNILQQQKKFALRGENEVAALKKVHHIIGRTDWDRACTQRIHADAKYHFCNETLREPFYEGQWTYESCQKHRIFASSCEYPLKGFHYMIEALAEVLEDYPDATLAVPGKSFLTVSPLRQTSYQKYLATLAKQYGVADKIEFMGKLSPEDMKAQFLRSNVFALSSSLENSPNTLGEAMLLGVPSVSTDVGGVKNLMTHGEEGYVCQSTAPYMLSYYIKQIFAMEEKAAALGKAARLHAGKTHDPEKNLQDLLDIYQELMGGV